MIRSIAIDSLRITLGDMRGHEHRIEPIMQRMGQLVAERLHERWPEQDTSRFIDHIGVVVPAGVDMRSLTDEEAADAIATTLADSVLQQLE